MDLVAGVRRVVVVMEHVARAGDAKILPACALPRTGVGVVDLIVTDLGVIRRDREPGGLTLAECAPGVTPEFVCANTAAPLRMGVSA